MRALALCVLLVACSQPPKHGNGTGTGTASRPDAGASAGPDAAPGPLTESECEAVIDHILDAQLAEMAKHKKADEMPTDEQVANLRVKLRGEMMDQCLVWDRASYQCIMAAPDLAAIEVCAGGG
jgi:small lipoprotein (TIGR04454 family)